MRDCTSSRKSKDANDSQHYSDPITRRNRSGGKWPIVVSTIRLSSLQFAEKLVHRAESSGYRAIVLTVDLPTLGNREKDRRNNVLIPPPPFFEANFVGVEKSGQEWVTLTWESLSWLRSITSLPILLKGILTAEDALLAK